MNDIDSFTRFCASFVDELVSSGVDQVVISPGSRSTPLAMLMAEHPQLTCYINIDERSAGFFALGVAKAQQKPVALLCTSGTAAANYYPAVVEAHYARVPLLVLTADRPHELRDVGAPQAIDQIRMYANYPKWFVDVALPEEQSGMLRYIRTVAGRAVAMTKTQPAGVVHLNFPFREPLIPNLNLHDLWGKQNNRNTYLEVPVAKTIVSDDVVENLVSMVRTSTRGLIVCGELEDQDFLSNVQKLSEHLKFPILADPLSQLRSRKGDKLGIIASYDSILKNSDFTRELLPDIVIRFGAMPVSKPLTQLLKDNPEIVQVVIDQAGIYRDPTLNASFLIASEETSICQILLEKVERSQNSTYYEKWISCNEIYWETIKASMEMKTDLFEGKVIHELQKHLPNQSVLYIGNSMPIRDVDAFFNVTDKEVKLIANRGASGIDGIVSSALGAAAGAALPTYLLIGDLSFYHDLNGLLAASQNDLDLTIILINNNGGGIFSFLPQSKEEKHFEMLYGTPIGLDFSKAAALYNASYQRIYNWMEFGLHLKSIHAMPGLKILEIPTDRKTRVKDHRDLLDHVSQEIRNVLKQ